MSSPRVAIIFYSMYGHIAKLAEAIKFGIESAGGEATILQVPETLPENILGKLGAPTKPDYPVVTVNSLKEYDAFLFGVPARYGGMSAQWKTFWDATGQLWAKGALTGKYAGIFVSTSSLGGGQEETAFSFLSTLVHHGIIFVPLGYAPAFEELTSLDELRGGSSWGSGTLSGSDNSRQPSPVEITIAENHGRSFYNLVSRVNF